MDKTTAWLVRGAAVVVIGFGAASLFSQTPEQKEQAEFERMSREGNKIAKKELKKYCANECLTYNYEDFKHAVKENKVRSLLIWPDLGEAFIEFKDGQKAKVNLDPDADLLDLLQRNNVDIRVGSS